MNETSNVVTLRHPDEIDDPLTSILRSGARQLLAQAVEMEAETFLASMKDLKLADGRDRFVRHGHGPVRSIQTGIGAVEVARVRIRDRAAASDGERIRFTSAILPLWARRTKSLDALLPVLYLRGISTGDFQEALAALLGKDAPNLSPAVISRLTTRMAGRVRALADPRFVGAPVRVRLGGRRVPAGPHGRPQRMHAGADRCDAGRQEGADRLPGRRARERAELARAAGRGEEPRTEDRPEIAVGDGALGFWKALDEVFPATRHQRCWVHKTANMLNKVALSVQANMKKDLREVYLAPNRASAEVAIDVFAEKYAAKYDKAVECLTKDRDAMLALYDFPAEHWDHLRTTNPIESVFATVRHRTVRTKGSLSSTTARLMVFKLLCAASKTWRRLKGTNQLPKVIAGVRFENGIEVIEVPANHAA